MKNLLFTIYIVRVGTTEELPIRKIITEAEEECYREFHRSREWNMWADKNRVYRNVRIEVKPLEENIA